jgi:DNA-binding CsgD family transcriptional regulator
MSFPDAPITALARSWSSDALLRGRRDECGALNQLLAGARAGDSGVLVLTGEPGIGKTALLEYAVRSAAELTVVRATGAQAEMELAFAALHQVCAPLLASLDKLPSPQRAALETTFGFQAGPVPDRFLVGLAVLGLLSEGASERPILCVVDDAQWLDRASAQTLAFVARRLLADSILMLFATREPVDVVAGLPRLTIEGLDDAAARELLASVLPGRLDERVAEQLLAETRGNPLALLELSRGLAASELAGGFGLPRARSLQGRIEESFRQRLERLPSDTQELLLVAAAEPLGDPALLWRAAANLRISASARVPAEEAGLLEIDRRVRFLHPLVRSAIYEAAQPSARRRVHHALAEATDPDAEPDRRAWHRAEAAAEPDEEIALELVQAAGRAQARGGLAAAAAFFERAGALEPDSQLQADRNFAAARTKYEAGALREALDLLAALQRSPVDDARRAEIQLLHAQIAYAARRGSDAPLLLFKAARRLETVNPALARATYVEALSAAMFVGRLGRGGDVVEISEAALAGPPLPDVPEPSDLLLHGLAVRFTQGFAAGAPLLKEALRAFQREDLRAEETQSLWFASRIALYLWDDEAWMALATRQLDLVRESGAMTALPFILSLYGSVFAFRDDLGAAAALAEELRATTEATGIATFPYAGLSIAAVRGREAEFAELVRTTVSEAESRGEGSALTVTAFLSGTLYNGLGRYEAALSALDGVDRFLDEGAAMWALVELIEAAVRLGQLERAGHALELLAETTQAAGTEWGLGVEARCRALLSEDDRAEPLYLEAIERLSHSSVRVYHARAHLLYGEWLRRGRRRMDAREQLRTAYEMFDAIGAEGYAERAARELLATGEHARKRTVETRSDMTPQELQIARLARDGLSNAEIGSRLFLSRHTVEYHLRKVFMKLGINSRTKLAGVLPPESSSALSA